MSSIQPYMHCVKFECSLNWNKTDIWNVWNDSCVYSIAKWQKNPTVYLYSTEIVIVFITPLFNFSIDKVWEWQTYYKQYRVEKMSASVAFWKKLEQYIQLFEIFDGISTLNQYHLCVFIVSANDFDPQYAIARFKVTR